MKTKTKTKVEVKSKTKVKAKVKSGWSTKITNEPASFPIDSKRFYLESSISVTCPVCGKDAERDFKTDYLSYPVCNEPFDVIVQCEDCVDKDLDADIPVSVILHCKLELA